MTRLRVHSCLIGLLVVGILALAFAFAHVSTRQGSDERRTAGSQQRTEAALCTFLADLRSRESSGEKFLEAHPRGIPGISAGVIRTSLTGEQHTIRALRSLICPPTP